MYKKKLSMKRLNVIYFSAAGTTERVAKCVETAIEDVKYYPLKDNQTKRIEIESDDLVIFATPAFRGEATTFCVGATKTI